MPHPSSSSPFGPPKAAFPDGRYGYGGPTIVSHKNFSDGCRGNDGPPMAPHRNTKNLNGQIMLSAILSLSCVVVVVISLHLYARYVLRRQAHGQIVVRRLGLADGHTPSGEPPNTGLEPTVIASLPMFVYKKEEGQDDATECAVCLSILEDQEMARILPNCKHTFHAECIDKWLSSRSTCPICRTEAEPRVQPQPREGPAGVVPVAPTLDHVNSMLVCLDGTTEICGPIQSSPSAKVSSSGSRLSSFRWMLSRERSSPRNHSEIQADHGFEDLERQ